jgi:ATP-dependent protease Clp ATPase subunit
MNVGIPFYTVPLDGSNSSFTTNNNDELKHGSSIINNDKYDLKLEKSNILMLGPTGSGKFQKKLNFVFAQIFHF